MGRSKIVKMLYRLLVSAQDLSHDGTLKAKRIKKFLNCFNYLFILILN